MIAASLIYLFVAGRRQMLSVSLNMVDTVSAVVAESAKETGLKLKVDPAIAPIRVYAHVADVSWDEFSARLAAMTRASWVDESGARILRRTAQQKKQLAAAQLAWDASGIQGALTQLPSSGAKSPEEEARDIAKALKHELGVEGPQRFMGPSDALLNEFLLFLGSEALAGIRPFEIRLYSNKPTACETLLPAASRLVDRYKAVSLALADYLKDENAVSGLGKYEYDRIVSAARQAARTDRVLVGVYLAGHNVTASLAIYDDAGKNLSAASATLFSTKAAEVGTDPRVSDPMVWPEKTTKALAFLGKPDPGHEKETVEICREPLYLQAVPGLDGLASSRNILCPLPDETAIRLFRSHPATTIAFRRVLATSLVATRVSEKWVSGELTPDGFDLYHYADRSALRTYCDQTVQGKPSWLHRLSQYYGSAGDAASNSLVLWLSDACWPPMHVKPEFQLTSRWQLFVLGTLSEDEWQALESGKPVSGTVIPERTSRLEQWSWSAIRAFEPIQPAICADSELIGSYSFPNGPPIGSTIQLESTNDLQVENEAEQLPWMDLASLANWACETAPEHTEEGALKALKGKFNLGRKPGTRLVATFDSRLRIVSDQPAGEIEIIQSDASLSDWPEDVRANLLKEIRSYLAGRGKDSVPPP